VVYIIFLHIQLTKKNLFIESTVKRLYGAEKTWTSDELMSFFNEIRKVQHYKTLFNDKLFEEKPLAFLLGNEKNSKIYIHYTREEYVARNIIQKGFIFVDSFYKTALPVNQDRLDLLMKHNSRKSFGDYLIIICLGNRVANRYSAEIEQNRLKGVSIENILTEESPSKNENGDMVYLLPNKFVKGFINHQTGEIVNNPEFDPDYESPNFIKNLQSFKAMQMN
jgi:hypothetical protein